MSFKKIISKVNRPLAIVDDNEVEVITARRYIHKLFPNIKLLTFSSGEEIIDYLENTSPDNIEDYPAIILMDINMPRMTGIEALELIRQNKGLNDIPEIIMFTASSNPDDKIRSINAGANDCVSKPINSDEYSIFFSRLVS